MTNTPNGYSLRNPGTRVSDYLYRSDFVYHYDMILLPDDTYYMRAETKVRLVESVTGGSSHYWQLTFRTLPVSNADGLTWYFTQKYWCGVNVSGGQDHICDNAADESGTEMPVSDSGSIYRYWGTVNSITVFPMEDITTHFSSGISVTTKFRGWDTLSRASTNRLAPSSDG